MSYHNEIVGGNGKWNEQDESLSLRLKNEKCDI